MAEPGPDPRDDDSTPPAKPSWSDRFFGLAPVKRDDEANERRRQSHSLSAAGFELAAGIGLFAGLGYLLDRWLGLLPWGTVAGALLGMIGGMYLLIKAAQNREKNR